MKKKDKIDDVSENLIEKSGLAGENTGPFLKWLVKYGFKLTIGVLIIAVVCLLAYGRGILDPLYKKKK
jgi:hypothetical protein